MADPIAELAVAVAEKPVEHVVIHLPVKPGRNFHRLLDELRNHPKYAGVKSITGKHKGNYGGNNRYDWFPFFVTLASTIMERPDCEPGTVGLDLTNMTHNGFDPNFNHPTRPIHVMELNQLLNMLEVHNIDPLHTVVLKGMRLLGSTPEFDAFTDRLKVVGKNLILDDVCGADTGLDSHPAYRLTWCLEYKTALTLKDAPWAADWIQRDLPSCHRLKELNIAGFPDFFMGEYVLKPLIANPRMQKLEIGRTSNGWYVNVGHRFRDLLQGLKGNTAMHTLTINFGPDFGEHSNIREEIKQAAHELVHPEHGNNHVIKCLACDPVELSTETKYYLKINRECRPFVGDDNGLFNTMVKNNDDLDVIFWLFQNNTHSFFPSSNSTGGHDSVGSNSSARRNSGACKRRRLL